MTTETVFWKKYKRSAAYSLSDKPDKLYIFPELDEDGKPHLGTPSLYHNYEYKRFFFPSVDDKLYPLIPSTEEALSTKRIVTTARYNKEWVDVKLSGDSFLVKEERIPFERVAVISHPEMRSFESSQSGEAFEYVLNFVPLPAIIYPHTSLIWTSRFTEQLATTKESNGNCTYGSLLGEVEIECLNGSVKYYPYTCPIWSCLTNSEFRTKAHGGNRVKCDFTLEETRIALVLLSSTSLPERTKNERLLAFLDYFGVDFYLDYFGS